MDFRNTILRKKTPNVVTAMPMNNKFMLKPPVAVASPVPQLKGNTMVDSIVRKSRFLKNPVSVGSVRG